MSEDFDSFDPDNLSKEKLKFLAKHLEAYLELLEENMIIPDEIIDDQGPVIKEGIKRTKKLIEKLRKGDTSVFKDAEDWNPIL